MTVAALAQAIGVSTKTIAAWRDDHADWPGKEPDGTFSIAKVLAFCKRHRLGPFNETRGSGNLREELAEAKVALTREQAENERIKKERQMVEQAVELGEVLDREFVLRWHGQLAGVVTTSLDAIEEPIDRALPRDMPDADREKVLDVLRRAVGAVRTAALDFAKGPIDDEE